MTTTTYTTFDAATDAAKRQGQITGRMHVACLRFPATWSVIEVPQCGDVVEVRSDYTKISTNSVADVSADGSTITLDDGSVYNRFNQTASWMNGSTYITRKQKGR